MFYAINWLQLVPFPDALHQMLHQVGIFFLHPALDVFAVVVLLARADVFWVEADWAGHTNFLPP